MARKTARKSAKKRGSKQAPAQPRYRKVTTDQAKRILKAQGLSRTVSVIRDRLDPNRIREILIRE